MTPEEQRDRLVVGIREALQHWHQSYLWKDGALKGQASDHFFYISRLLDEAMLEAEIREPDKRENEIWNEAVERCLKTMRPYTLHNERLRDAIASLKRVDRLLSPDEASPSA